MATSPTPTGGWNAVDFVGGVWIALGHSSHVAVSLNGVSWTEHSVPAGSWQSVTFGRGLFVALNAVNASPHEIVSSNGADWSSSDGPAGQWTSVAYGAGHFVAVGSLGQVATSSDGVTWATTFSRRLDHFTSVAYGNGRFIAVDGAQGDTLVSVDARHWGFYPVALAGLTWGAVAYGNGNFSAFDTSGAGYVATTVMGYEWTLHRYAPAEQINGATYGCGDFVGVGSTAGPSGEFISSPTGATWQSSLAPGDASDVWTSVAYGAHRFVAVDSSGDIATAPSNAHCSMVTPTTPQQVSGNIHNGEVWTYMHPPSAPGTAPVDSYRVTISDGVTTKYCYAPVYYEPNCIIRGLVNRHVYQVTAQAHNRYGFSVPTDPEFVIPIASWSLDAVTTAPVISDAGPAIIQVTGILANSLGFYPDTLVTVHFGARTLQCRPSPFGECLIAVVNPSLGPTTIFATYTGYGRSYRSPTAHVTVTHVNVSSTNVGSNAAITIQVHRGVAHSIARATIGSGAVQSPLDSAGSGSIHLSAPSSPGTYVLSVQDAGVAICRVTITVHS